MAWVATHRSGFRVTWRNAVGKEQHGPTFTTKSDAVCWGVDAGRIEAQQQLLIKLARDYCESRQADRGIQAGYAYDLEFRLASTFEKRGWKVTTDVTLSEIDRWWKDTKGVGVDRPLAQVLALLRWANRHRDADVHSKVLTYKKPRGHRIARAQERLTGDDIGAVLDLVAGLGTMPIHLVALMHYLATYGPRPVSACEVKISDIRFGTKMMKARGKHSGSWWHPLRNDTLKLFAACALDRRQDEYLFINWRGMPWKVTLSHEAEQLSWWYKKNVSTKLDLALLGVYKLKDYAISVMKKNGMTNSEIAVFTGHLTLSQIDTYEKAGVEQYRSMVAQLPAAHLPRLLPQTLPPATPPRGAKKQRKPPPSGRRKHR